MFISLTPSYFELLSMRQSDDIKRTEASQKHIQRFKALINFLTDNLDLYQNKSKIYIKWPNNRLVLVPLANISPRISKPEELGLFHFSPSELARGPPLGPQHRGFVCAYFPAAPDSINKHTTIQALFLFGVIFTLYFSFHCEND